MKFNFLRVQIYILLVISSVGNLKAQNEFTPDFSLSFNDFQKTAVKEKEEIWVVDFWASWCMPCIQAIPDLKLIYEKYKDKTVKFVSVSWDEDSEDWKAAIEHFKIEWVQVKIPKPSMPQPFIEQNFKQKFIPALFIVSPEGKVKKTGEGMLEQQLDNLLAKMEK